MNDHPGQFSIDKYNAGDIRILYDNPAFDKAQERMNKLMNAVRAMADEDN